MYALSFCACVKCVAQSAAIRKPTLASLKFFCGHTCQTRVSKCSSESISFLDSGLKSAHCKTDEVHMYFNDDIKLAVARHFTTPCAFAPRKAQESFVMSRHNNL